MVELMESYRATLATLEARSEEIRPNPCRYRRTPGSVEAWYFVLQEEIRELRRALAEMADYWETVQGR